MDNNGKSILCVWETLMLVAELNKSLPLGAIIKNVKMVPPI